MAREAGFIVGEPWREMLIKRFEALVRADEQEKYKWDVHSCGPTCNRYACVAMREAVEAEREACAKVCEELHQPYDAGESWEDGTYDCAAAIRARSKDEK
jgi:hypothetical protein